MIYKIAILATAVLIMISGVWVLFEILFRKAIGSREQEKQESLERSK